MSDELIGTILKNTGLFGAVFVAFGLAIRHLQTLLTDAQEKRIADGQAAAARLLEVVKGQQEHMALLANALQGTRDTLGDIERLLERMDRERALAAAAAVSIVQNAPVAGLPPSARLVQPPPLRGR